jgi:hypothetical protein
VLTHNLLQVEAHGQQLGRTPSEEELPQTVCAA